MLLICAINTKHHSQTTFTEPLILRTVLPVLKTKHSLQIVHKAVKIITLLRSHYTTTKNWKTLLRAYSVRRTVLLFTIQ